VNEIERSYLIPADRAGRLVPMLLSRIGTYGRYRRGNALVKDVSGDRDDDGAWTIRVRLLSPCRPTLRFVGRRERLDMYRRADLRKAMKMLTAAQGRRSMTPPQDAASPTGDPCDTPCS
jgi:hypothetical protein